ncbi:MAG TPA: GNAT family N-acetyltransferase [Anaerolineae bacterium]|nr:GNAT family N-acetyltransferase [Anaerolineae bacterium]
MEITIRQATAANEKEVLRLIRDARRVCLHFKVEELKDRLETEPFLVAYARGRLVGFMFWDLHYSYLARLRGAGLADRWPVSEYLRALLPPSLESLRAQGAATLAYVGSDDWLIEPLQEHGFVVDNIILAYQKADWAVPSRGNQEVLVRPTQPDDFPALVALDQAAFEPLWQNTARVFQDVLANYPYFVVAELEGTVVGYQFSSLLGDRGYLARVAVHPDYQGRGIGTRLLAEAIAFFKQEGVRAIILNTQQDNQASQRLYRWFGFKLVGEEAVVLKFNIPSEFP